MFKPFMKNLSDLGFQRRDLKLLPLTRESSLLRWTSPSVEGDEPNTKYFQGVPHPHPSHFSSKHRLEPQELH